MLRNILIYGLIGGVIVALPTGGLPIMLAGHYGALMNSWGMVIGYASMLIALSTVFLGIKHQRDTAGGGVIKFLPALGMGLAISFVAGVLYTLSWEFAMAVTHMDFIGGYARGEIAKMKASGASAAALQAFMAQMDALQRQYADPFYRMPMTFMEIAPVGVLVSIVSAGLLCFPRFLPAKRS